MPNREIKVEHNVPAPLRVRHPYPWREMQVGDSFLFPANVSNAYQCVRDWSCSVVWPGRKYIARKTAEGIRCWRIA